MPTDPILGRLRRGVGWTYSTTLAGAIIQVAVTATTARLLDPEAFGLIAMANVVLRFGGYFAQMGVGRALIQRPTITSADIQGSFTSSTMLGLAVAVIVWLSAPLVGGYYNDLSVVPLVRWLSLTFIASGLGATAHALLRRQLRFRESGIVRIASYTVGYAAPALVLAYSGFGVMSLVAAAILQPVSSTAFSYFLTRHSLRLTFAPAVHKRLLGYGAKVSFISLLEYIGSALDSLVVGRFGSAAQLGLYNRAYTLAVLPTYELNSGIAKVLFPVLSTAQSDLRAFVVTLQRSTTIAVKLVLAVGFGMAVAAPEVVLVTLGSQWTDAIPLFRILAIGQSVSVLATFPGIALEALASLRGKAIIQVAYVAGLTAAMVASVALWGFDLFTVVLLVAAAHGSRVVAFFVLAFANRAYESRYLTKLVATALASALLPSAAIGLSLELARGLDMSTFACLIVAIFSGTCALGLLFASDLKRAIRAMPLRSWAGRLRRRP